MNDPARWAWLGGLPCALCLILFVVALAWIPWGWPGVILSGTHVSGITSWNASPWAFPTLLIFGFCLLVQAILAVWVGVDANRRGLNGFLWGALVFFTCVVGLVVYLIVTRSGAACGPVGPVGSSACRSCGARVQPDFRVCPFCGQPLGNRCANCNRPVATDWKTCPHCATALGSAT